MNKITPSSEPTSLASITLEPDFESQVTLSFITRENKSDGGYREILSQHNSQVKEVAAKWGGLTLSQKNTIVSALESTFGPFGSLLINGVRYRPLDNALVKTLDPDAFEVTCLLELIP